MSAWLCDLSNILLTVVIFPAGSFLCMYIYHEDLQNIYINLYLCYVREFTVNTVKAFNFET